MNENNQTLKNNDNNIVIDELSELLLKHGINDFVICYKIINDDSEGKVVYFPSTIDEYKAAQMLAHAKNELSNIIADKIS